MSKKIKDEKGRTYVEKKPFYKRVWFWVVIVFFAIMIFGGSGSEEEPTTKEEAATEETQKEDSTLGEDKVFKVGQTIQFNHIEMKVDEVKFLPNDDMNEASQGKQFVGVKVTIKNNSDEVLDYNPYDFKLNADGNRTDMDAMYTAENEYGNNTLNAGELEKGASVTGCMVGEANKNTKKLELDYNGDLFTEEAKITINLK